MKEQVRAEMAQLEAAQNLASAALALYGALRATELRQPRLVLNCLPALESAIEGWSRASEIEPMPASEETRC